MIHELALPDAWVRRLRIPASSEFVYSSKVKSWVDYRQKWITLPQPQSEKNRFWCLHSLSFQDFFANVFSANLVWILKCWKITSGIWCGFSKFGSENLSKFMMKSTYFVTSTCCTNHRGTENSQEIHGKFTGNSREIHGKIHGGGSSSISLVLATLRFL